jgi:hypothetical protein
MPLHILKNSNRKQILQTVSGVWLITFQHKVFSNKTGKNDGAETLQSNLYAAKADKGQILITDNNFTVY